MFKIATQAEQRPYGSMSGPTDGVISYRNRGEHAERKHRHIIDEIETCETPQDVDAVLARHDAELDALYLDYPDYFAAVQEAADDQRIYTTPKEIQNGSDAMTNAGAPARNATAQSTTIEKDDKMFTIDTGDTGGSLGPWISWTSNGSAMKGFQPKKWVLRSKDDAGEKHEEMIPAFENGCVLDLDTLKLGWEKDGAKGQAPERKWNPSISQATPRPDESKKASGSFAWSRALSIRCAIGGGQAATWEQGSFAAYAAFEALAKQIEAQWAAHSQNGALLPLVKQTSVNTRELQSGSANIPVLEIVEWVARPDCLKADAPVIATSAPQPTPVQQEAPAAPAAPHPAVSAAGGF